MFARLNSFMIIGFKLVGLFRLFTNFSLLYDTPTTTNQFFFFG